MDHRDSAFNADLSRGWTLLRNRLAKSYFFFISELVLHCNFTTLWNLSNPVSLHSWTPLLCRRFRFDPVKTKLPCDKRCSAHQWVSWLYGGNSPCFAARIGIPRLGILKCHHGFRGTISLTKTFLASDLPWDFGTRSSQQALKVFFGEMNLRRRQERFKVF